MAKPVDKEVFAINLESRLGTVVPQIQASSDPDEIAKLLKQAIDEAKDESPLASDVVLYRVAVWSLAIVMVLAAIGYVSIALVWGKDVEIPAALVALGSAAVGALAGLLTPPGGG